MASRGSTSEAQATSRWRAAGVILSAAFRADPARAAGVLALSVVNTLALLVWFVLLKQVVDAVVQGDERRTVAAAAILGLAVGGERLASFVHTRLSVGLGERTGQWVKEHLARIMGGLPGIEHLERPDVLLELELLWEDPSVFSQALASLVANVMLALRVVGIFGLLAAVHPLLLLLPTFTLVPLALGARWARLRERARELTAESRRRALDLFDLATTPGPGKELRIYGLASEILDRQATEWNRIATTRARLEWRGSLLEWAGWLALAVGYTGAVALVAIEGISGRATPGDVVLVLTLAPQIVMQFTLVSGSLGWLVGLLATVGRYVWLADYAAGVASRSEPALPAPERLEHGIVFQDVGFRYPGTQRDVLVDVDLVLPAGATVALVGDNGAGKTTLVKLLCRFYQPTRGRILLDGVDLQDLDVEDWRRHISAGFQDFLRMEFLVHESVGCGDLPRINDATAVQGALERAGAADVVAPLPHGLHTPLGRSFEDGAELSTGQWQKLALGRAMMRAPLLLILDEPTSGLDAPTEQALFEQYAAGARRASRQTGAVTLLVSHRFSTVRMADLIVVIQQGRVLESGRHEELMARRGLYAELYTLQARTYSAR